MSEREELELTLTANKKNGKKNVLNDKHVEEDSEHVVLLVIMRESVTHRVERT